MVENNTNLKHLAIIMDGNRRWAKENGASVKDGHKAGAEKLSNFVKWCIEFNIKYLTVYAFSTENWKRDKEEVDDIMSLLNNYLSAKKDEFYKSGVKVKMIGAEDNINKDILAKIRNIEEYTKNNNKIQLNIAFNYGGRREILDATQQVVVGAAGNVETIIKDTANELHNGEEAFSLEGDNKFNKVNVAEQLTRIRALKQCPPIETGFLEYAFKDGKHAEENINGFKWIPNQNGKIKILEHPIWTLPQKEDENGKVIWSPPSERIRNLYVIGIDGIDIGKAQTSEYTKDPSDFCLTVFKRAYGLEEPQFVAMYKDRPNDVRECYKIAIKLAQYYNAVINIEATRQSIIPYARERKLLKLFMRRPRATLTDSMINTNKQYGTPATPAIIDHQTDLMADYVNDYCHLIWFDEMLDELNRYTDENKRKFDIVAAACMALLADEELQGMVPKMVETKVDTWEQIGYYTDEQGRRRYGVIPNKNTQIPINNNFGQLYDDNRIRTSNTRLLSGYLW